MPSFILCQVSYYAKFHIMPSFILCQVSYYAMFHTIVSGFILCVVHNGSITMQFFPIYMDFELFLCKITNAK